MKRSLLKYWYLIRVISIRFVQDRLTYSASALTFTTLLALVPLLTVSFSILSIFPVFSDLKSQIQPFIFNNFLPASGEVVQHYLHSFVDHASNLSLFGTLFLVATVVMMMLTIEQAFNHVWMIKSRRRGFSSLVQYWAALSLAPIFIGLSIVLTSYLISLPFITNTVSSLGVKPFLVRSIPFIVTVFVFTALYVGIPNCSVPFKNGLIGAVIATIFFELTKKAFVLYVASFANYHLIYGTLSVIPVFLLWIYLLWVIILFGVLISNVLTIHRFIRSKAGMDGFTHAFVWLAHLWKAQQRGKGMSLGELYKAVPVHYKVNMEQQLKCLQEAKLIQLTARNRYVLTRDLSRMTLLNLYAALPWKLSSAESFEHMPCAVKMVFQKSNQSLEDALNVSLGSLYMAWFNEKERR